MAFLSALYLVFCVHPLYFGAFAVNSYWYNKLDCWWFPPFIIVLFCLLILITEIFSIRLTVSIENRSIFSLGIVETGDIIKQECNKAANVDQKIFTKELYIRFGPCVS